LKEELLQNVTVVEERKEQPSSRRPCDWILLGLLLIGVVVEVVLGIVLSKEDGEPKPV
jgi:hypothetical protein